MTESGANIFSLVLGGTQVDRFRFNLAGKSLRHTSIVY